MWECIAETAERLAYGGYAKTSATKNVTRGAHKGKWRLWWNPAQGGVWIREGANVK